MIQDDQYNVPADNEIILIFTTGSVFVYYASISIEYNVQRHRCLNLRWLSRYNQQLTSTLILNFRSITIEHLIGMFLRFHLTPCYRLQSQQQFRPSILPLCQFMNLYSIGHHVRFEVFHELLKFRSNIFLLAHPHVRVNNCTRICLVML